MLTIDRLNGLIGVARERCAALDADALAKLDATCALEGSDHFQFQNLQAQAHAMGVLDTEAAALVYRALGESGVSDNGGWTAGTDTATKAIVTQLMGELLAQKLKGRRAA